MQNKNILKLEIFEQNPGLQWKSKKTNRNQESHTSLLSPYLASAGMLSVLKLQRWRLKVERNFINSADDETHQEREMTKSQLNQN